MYNEEKQVCVARACEHASNELFTLKSSKSSDCVCDLKQNNSLIPSHPKRLTIKPQVWMCKQRTVRWWAYFRVLNLKLCLHHTVQINAVTLCLFANGIKCAYSEVSSTLTLMYLCTNF